MTVITKEDGKRQLPFDEARLLQFIDEVTERFPHLDIDDYKERIVRTIKSKDQYKAEQITNRLVLEALDCIGTEDGEHPDWTYVASEVHLRSLYKLASNNRSYDASEKYGDFYGLLKNLTSKGIYDSTLLRQYSKEDIAELANIIDPECDKLYTYIGLKTLSDRYLATDHFRRVYELPQERSLVIAMHIMSREPKKHRVALVKEAYWALSNLYMTVATPTLSNAGKTHGQLSSCFIETIDDSLRGIYDSNTDVASLSKNGGGIGTYWGFVRAHGASIKGFKGIGNGVVPWLKLYNQTAVSVDQLGQRQGSIVAYLPVWHKDTFSFLDLRLNNGDERFRAHDLFLGAVIPDLFMEQVEKRGDWAMFDPKEVFDAKGWYLDDFYDEEEGRGSFREKYYELLNDPSINKQIVPAIEIMKRIMQSQLETGVPFMFYRDAVNRANPNKHLGIIYCSNLCSEIAQNMSATKVIEEKTEDGKIVIYKEIGDAVVCNLSSINLGRAVPANVLERLIHIQVRMLDNVIELNEDRIEVQQFVETNKKYRAIGLGTFGWAHLLALNGIKWESDKAVAYADELYEKIAFLTIQASAELAREKGAYPAFVGSEWETGEYFRRRGYDSFEWKALEAEVALAGIRNGYLMAVAPNGSTAIIGGSTPSIDPIFKKVYAEEKKDYKIPVTVPDLNARTNWFYKSAYSIDQLWSIRQNAARTRHIDQSQSFNLYVTNDIPARDFLELHLSAWREGLKTTYYVRSTSLEIAKECESCMS